MDKFKKYQNGKNYHVKLFCFQKNKLLKINKNIQKTNFIFSETKSNMVKISGSTRLDCTLGTCAILVAASKSCPVVANSVAACLCRRSCLGNGEGFQLLEPPTHLANAEK